MNTAGHDHFRHSLHSVESVRALERALVQARGINTCDLMEQAGRAVFKRARANWPDARRWCVVCGSGNNGGDGYVVARLARVQGFDVTLIRVGESQGPAEASAARAGYAACGGSATSLRLARTDAMPELIIDALFGIGLDRAVSGEAAQAIDWINDRGCPVLSIDVPSGLNADTGATPGACVRALMTLTLVAWKRGQFTGRARAFTGVLQLDPLGADVDVHGIEAGSERLIAAAEVRALLRPRARDAHKGDHGHVLVVGGDQGMGGATLLAAESALRSGAGWVSLATRAEHLSASLARCPEVMVRAVLTPLDLQPMLARADVVLLGPGLGQGDWGRQLLLAVLASGKPLVLDADALNLIAGEALSLPIDMVLTPHPGEAARLLGTTTALVEHDRFAAVRGLQARFGGVAVLKGAGTLICNASHLEICDRGNPGMASAGMGDVLAGIIAALRAQGLSAFDAARAGVFVHASAGDLAAGKQGERGLVARDLMAQLAPVLNP